MCILQPQRRQRRGRYRTGTTAVGLYYTLAGRPKRCCPHKARSAPPGLRAPPALTRSPYHSREQLRRARTGGARSLPAAPPPCKLSSWRPQRALQQHLPRAPANCNERRLSSVAPVAAQRAEMFCRTDHLLTRTPNQPRNVAQPVARSFAPLAAQLRVYCLHLHSSRCAARLRCSALLLRCPCSVTGMAGEPSQLPM